MTPAAPKVPDRSDDEWFIALEGEVLGPMDLDSMCSLEELLAHGGAIWAGSGLSQEQLRAWQVEPKKAGDLQEAGVPPPAPRSRGVNGGAARRAAIPRTMPAPEKDRTLPRILLGALLLVEVGVVTLLFMVLISNGPDPDFESPPRGT